MKRRLFPCRPNWPVFTLAIAAAWAAFFFPGPVWAAAQGVCAARETLVRHLAERFDESRRAVAIATTGAVLEVFVSPAGSWTVLATVPGGPTCAVAAGHDWEWQGRPGADPRLGSKARIG